MTEPEETRRMVCVSSQVTLPEISNLSSQPAVPATVVCLVAPLVHVRSAAGRSQGSVCSRAGRTPLPALGLDLGHTGDLPTAQPKAFGRWWHPDASSLCEKAVLQKFSGL